MDCAGPCFFVLLDRVWLALGGCSAGEQFILYAGIVSGAAVSEEEVWVRRLVVLRVGKFAVMRKGHKICYLPPLYAGVRSDSRERSKL